MYLDEHNIVPVGYENSKLESKGFKPSTEIPDFPIRGHKVTLHIRRRRWMVLDTDQIITIDWDLVHEDAQMTTEFGLFFRRYLDNHPVSAHLVGLFFQMDGKQLQDQYKNYLSDFHDWDQKPHAESWLLFA